MIIVVIVGIGCLSMRLAMSIEAAEALRNMDFHSSYAWMYARDDLIDIACAQALRGPAYVLPDVDNPLVVAGLGVSLGVGEAWMFVAKGFEGRYAWQVLQQQKLLCAAAVEVYELHRLHMMVDPDHPNARQWARAAGFEFEMVYKNGGIFGQDLEFWRFNQGKEVVR